MSVARGKAERWTRLGRERSRIEAGSTKYVPYIHKARIELSIDAHSRIRFCFFCICSLSYWRILVMIMRASVSLWHRSLVRVDVGYRAGIVSSCLLLLLVLFPQVLNDLNNHKS